MKKNIESITLKDLLYRHATFLKEKKEYFYEVKDVNIWSLLAGRNNSSNNTEFAITKIEPLKLRVNHEEDIINFEFGFTHEMIERKWFEELGGNKDILEDLFIQIKKIGKVTKTAFGFNLKLDLLKIFRYKANVFCYIKESDTQSLVDIKQQMISNGFEKKEIIYDINDYTNFLSMYERALKEGDLIVIPKLSMIENNTDSIKRLFLGFIQKKISFCIENYIFYYDLYKVYSKEEIINEMIDFFEFYIKSKKL